MKEASNTQQLTVRDHKAYNVCTMSHTDHFHHQFCPHFTGLASWTTTGLDGLPKMSIPTSVA